VALLACSRRTGHVGLDDMREIVALSPMARLARVGRDFSADAQVAGHVRDLRARYADFLERTSRSKEEQDTLFSDPTYRRARLAEGDAFGDVVFQLVAELGRDNRLYRYMVV
jgi:hypothetical protein